MRKFHAYNLSDWPRNGRGEAIFTSTSEAIYYAGIVEDRLATYNFLKKWRLNAHQNFEFLKAKQLVNYDRLFDLATRQQYYREAMEELQRLNDADDEGIWKEKTIEGKE